MLTDLSHSIHSGLITYKGLPAPLICDYVSREQSKAYYAEGTTFQIGKIEMVANSGTYIDAPYHRYESGSDASQLELSRIAGVDGIIISVGPDITAIDESFLVAHDVTDKAVLIRTDWSRHWNTHLYFEHHPYLTESSAMYLKNNRARIVGVDSYNIDDVDDGTRPVHSILLGAGIPIVEHLCNLELLPDHGFSFFAVPPRIRGMGTFPVRAFACHSEAKRV